MELIFLGTSAMVPTKDRNPSAVFLTYRDQGILFDCGEGTQRQLKIAGVPLSKLTKILITHFHGDHVFGLPGLLQSMAAQEYQGTLEIYGPVGLKNHIDLLQKLIEGYFQIKLKIIEVKDGVCFENEFFKLESASLVHKVPCVGFSFVEKDKRRINLPVVKKLGIPEGPLLGELASGKSVVFNGKKITPDQATTLIKGKKICFITDTKLAKSCYDLSENADLLICEGTYTSELKSKADEYLHMTAKDAGLVASKSNVQKLILTHFSARYKNTLEVEEDARQVFDNILCAKDFMKIKL